MLGRPIAFITTVQVPGVTVVTSQPYVPVQVSPPYPTRIAPPAYEQVEFEKAIENSEAEFIDDQNLQHALVMSNLDLQAKVSRHDAGNAEEAELQQAIQASLIEQEAEQIKEFANNAHHVKRTALIGEYITEQGLDHSETDSEVGDLIDFTRPVQQPLSSVVGQLSEGTLETSFLGAVERSSTVPATTVSASMNGELSDAGVLGTALYEAKTFAALSTLQRHPALIKAIVACQREVDVIDVSTDEGKQFKQACQEFKNYVVHKIVANKKFKDVKNINQLDNLTGLVGSMKNPGLTQEAKQKALETFAANVEKQDTTLMKKAARVCAAAVQSLHDIICRPSTAKNGLACVLFSQSFEQSELGQRTKSVRDTGQASPILPML